MQYMVSGQSGAAYSIEGRTLILDGVEKTGVSLGEAAPAFRDSYDCRRVKVSSVAEAIRMQVLARNQDYALRFFLHWIDPSIVSSVKGELGIELQELLERSDIYEFVENMLLSDVLPTSGIRPLDELDLQCDRPVRLYKCLVDCQPNIRTVLDSFESVVNKFESGAAAHLFYQRAVNNGAIAKLVKSLGDASTWSQVTFLLLSDFAGFPNNREIIQTWMKQLPHSANSRVQFNIVEDDRSDDDDQYEDQTQGAFGRQMLQNVRQQIAGIVDRLQNGDTNNAVRFANELVATQHTHSTPEQLAKSLCSISQRAKELGYQSLQEEWAREATLVAPEDSRTYGHLADALIQTRRFAEAREALHKSAQWGDKQYAETGYARIDSALGRFESARATFIAVAQAYPGTETEWIAKVGAAEALRDLDLPSEALSEYKRIVEKFPSVVQAHCGLAATYAQLGMFPESLRAYDVAIHMRRDVIVAMNGRATVFRELGKFSEALELYDEIIERYPHEPTAHCGRAEVLRLSGNVDGAVDAYKQIVDRFPTNPVALCALGDSLLAGGRRDEALEAFETGEVKFSHVGRFLTGVARTYLEMGLFEKALSKFDSAIQSFPYDLFAKRGRAKCLARLGRYEDSINQYKDLIGRHPDSASLPLELAAVYISQRRFDEALRILPEKYETGEQWFGHFLRQYIALTKDSSEQAVQKVLTDAKSIPFYRVRSKINNLIATVKLRERKFSDALHLVDKTGGGVADVIHLHAFAASKAIGDATHAFREYERQGPPAQLFDLATEIARRYHILSEQPKLTEEDLIEREATELLLDAA